MNYTEKRDLIREKAIEANPSILDLVFGCRIIETSYPGYTQTIWRVFPPLNGKTEAKTDMDNVDISDCEIIGRPCRLSDILLAMEGKLNKTLNEGITPENFSATAEMFQILFEKDSKRILNHWDLKNDDLTKQSEETVDFLYNLLK